MPEEPKLHEGTRNRMAPFRHVKSPAETRMPKDGYPEQEPPNRSSLSSKTEAWRAYPSSSKTNSMLFSNAAITSRSCAARSVPRIR